MPRYWLDSRGTPTARPSARFGGWLLAAVLAVLVTGGAVVLSDGATPPPPPPRTTPLRVMSLGDSITLGPDGSGGISGGNRPLLRERAQRDGLAVEFVGRLRTGPGGLPHEGYGGGASTSCGRPSTRGSRPPPPISCCCTSGRATATSRTGGILIRLVDSAPAELVLDLRTER